MCCNPLGLGVLSGGLGVQGCGYDPKKRGSRGTSSFTTTSTVHTGYLEVQKEETGPGALETRDTWMLWLCSTYTTEENFLVNEGP